MYPLLPLFIGLLACCLISMQCPYLKVFFYLVISKYASFFLWLLWCTCLGYLSSSTPTFMVFAFNHLYFVRVKVGAVLCAPQDTYKEDDDEPLVYGLLKRDADLLRFVCLYVYLCCAYTVEHAASLGRSNCFRSCSDK